VPTEPHARLQQISFNQWCDVSFSSSFESLLSAASLAANATILFGRKTEPIRSASDGELHIVHVDHDAVMIDPETSFQAHTH